MDPKATWREMWEAFEDVDTDKCDEHGMALMGWLKRGGFWPEDMRTPGGELVGRISAQGWVMRLRHWAKAHRECAAAV